MTTAMKMSSDSISIYILWKGTMRINSGSTMKIAPQKSEKHLQRKSIHSLAKEPYIYISTIFSYRSPFWRDSHKISLHCIRESSFVEWWLNDSRCFASHNHRETFSYSLHLLQDIVLPHEVDYSNDKLIRVFVNANQDRIVKNVDDGQKQSVLMKKSGKQ